MAKIEALLPMSIRPKRTPMEWLTDRLVKILVKEHRGYVQRFPNDPAKLRAALQPGDVVLVEGSQRISEVIKYLTQSSWSHAALFVGDALLKRGQRQGEQWRALYGDEADGLLVEANVEDGVTAVPPSKYANHNIRICRPINLRPGDLATVLDTVISQIGHAYDREHIRSLLWYLLPVEIMPKSWRQHALERSGELSKEVICSTQIAMAFQKVRYPIQPEISDLGSAVTQSTRLAEWSPFRRRKHRSLFERGLFTPCDPSLVTPRDFDLSPYFDVVKLAANGKKEFDYKKITWSPAEVATERAAVGGSDDEDGDVPELVAVTTAAAKTG